MKPIFTCDNRPCYNIAVAAATLTAGAAGAATNVRTSVLLTPEDIDQAAEKTVRYEPPGQ